MTKVDEPEPPEPIAADDADLRRAAETEAAAEDSAADLPQAETLPQYLHVVWVRIRSGDSGVLPVVGGLLLISILFQSLNSNFLSAGNLVNLLIQGAVYMLLAMGEVFALLLGEIDLSIGFVSGIGGVVAAELVKQSTGWPWWAAVLVALLFCAAIGAVQGTIITRLGLPSFVVTLAGLLGFQGVMLLILGQGGSLPINDHVINDFASGNLTPAASWIVMIAIVALVGYRTWSQESRRRSTGLIAPPASLTALKIAAMAVAGVIIVLICNTNRGRLVAIKGVPWVVLIVLGVLAAWTFLLGRTKFGRYVYAIGGNPEAARRAGISLARIRTICFVLVVVHGRHRRDHLRVPSAVGVDRARRRNARALRRRRRRHRRARASSEAGARRCTRCWAASSSPRSTTAWDSRATARPPSTSSPRSCCSRPSRSTRSPAATPRTEYPLHATSRDHAIGSTRSAFFRRCGQRLARRGDAHRAGRRRHPTPPWPGTARPPRTGRDRRRPAPALRLAAAGHRAVSRRCGR